MLRPVLTPYAAMDRERHHLQYPYLLQHVLLSLESEENKCSKTNQYNDYPDDQIHRRNWLHLYSGVSCRFHTLRCLEANRPIRRSGLRDWQVIFELLGCCESYCIYSPVVFICMLLTQIQWQVLNSRVQIVNGRNAGKTELVEFEEITSASANTIGASSSSNTSGLRSDRKAMNTSGGIVIEISQISDQISDTGLSNCMTKE